MICGVLSWFMRPWHVICCSEMLREILKCFNFVEILWEILESLSWRFGMFSESLRLYILPCEVLSWILLPWDGLRRFQLTQSPAFSISGCFPRGRFVSKIIYWNIGKYRLANTWNTWNAAYYSQFRAPCCTQPHIFTHYNISIDPDQASLSLTRYLHPSYLSRIHNPFPYKPSYIHPPHPTTLPI